MRGQKKETTQTRVAFERHQHKFTTASASALNCVGRAKSIELLKEYHGTVRTAHAHNSRSVSTLRHPNRELSSDCLAVKQIQANLLDPWNASIVLIRRENKHDN